jgi:hypothetical protein
MKLIRFSILLLTMLNFACARPNYGDDPQRGLASENEFALKDLDMHFYWDHHPVDEKDLGTFTLEFHNPQKSNEFRDPQNEVTAYLWMPEMNPPHGSRPLVLEHKQEGVYSFSEVSFFMRGTWEIHIQLKNGDQVVEEVIKSERF